MAFDNDLCWLFSTWILIKFVKTLPNFHNYLPLFYPWAKKYEFTIETNKKVFIQVPQFTLVGAEAVHNITESRRSLGEAKDSTERTVVNSITSGKIHFYDIYITGRIEEIFMLDDARRLIKMLKSDINIFDNYGIELSITSNSPKVFYVLSKIMSTILMANIEHYTTMALDTKSYEILLCMTCDLGFPADPIIARLRAADDPFSNRILREILLLKENASFSVFQHENQDLLYEISAGEYSALPGNQFTSSSHCPKYFQVVSQVKHLRSHVVRWLCSWYLKATY